MKNDASLISQLISGDDEHAENAVQNISEHGETAIPALTALLSSPDPDHRWWAVRTIAEIPSRLTPKLLIQSLDDPVPSVRHCAALGMRLQPDLRSIVRLIKELDNQDRLFASLAADALIAIGEDAVPELINIMENGSQDARMEALRALALIGDKRAIPVLFSVLDDESALIEHWADVGLERMGVGMTFFSPDQ